MTGSTAPKPYRCALDRGPREVTSLYLVLDTSDGDAVVGTFRNRVIAEREAERNPTYRVREYGIN
jgi:hypothetical protein